MNDIAQMLKRDLSAAEQAAERNRANFPTAAAMLDTVRTMDPTARIVYASENGREIGKRDPGPWISADTIIRAVDWSARGTKRRAAA